MAPNLVQNIKKDMDFSFNFHSPDSSNPLRQCAFNTCIQCMHSIHETTGFNACIEYCMYSNSIWDDIFECCFKAQSSKLKAQTSLLPRFCTCMNADVLKTVMSCIEWMYWMPSILSTAVCNTCTRSLYWVHIYSMQHGVASISRIGEFFGFFCKRALCKRRYSAQETYGSINPTDRSHPILHVLNAVMPVISYTGPFFEWLTCMCQQILVAFPNLPETYGFPIARCI